MSRATQRMAPSDLLQEAICRLQVQMQVHRIAGADANAGARARRVRCWVVVCGVREEPETRRKKGSRACRMARVADGLECRMGDGCWLWASGCWDGGGKAARMGCYCVSFALQLQTGRLTVASCCRETSTRTRTRTRKQDRIWDGDRMVDGWGQENHCRQLGTRQSPRKSSETVRGYSRGRENQERSWRTSRVVGGLLWPRVFSRLLSPFHLLGRFGTSGPAGVFFWAQVSSVAPRWVGWVGLLWLPTAGWVQTETCAEAFDSAHVESQRC